MASRKRGLGRGLDALLSSRPATERTEVPVALPDDGAGPDAAAAPAAPAGDALPGGERLVSLAVDELRPGRYQPRRAMDAERLEELAASIRANGVMQPIVARPLPSGRGHEIIAGERRWRAAQRAGLAAVPVIVREAPDEAAMALALIENIQREDLSPIEEATALKRLVDEFELTQARIAEIVGKSRTTITNLLRLLQLEGEVRELLEAGRIEMGHARALLTLEAAAQVRIAREVVARGLSVRQTEAQARGGDAAAKPKSKNEAKPAQKDADTQRLERSLSETVGAPVTIRARKGGGGELVIRYSSLDELEGVLAHIR